jgi:hypothetical protein
VTSGQVEFGANVFTFNTFFINFADARVGQVFLLKKKRKNFKTK